MSMEHHLQAWHGLDQEHLDLKRAAGYDLSSYHDDLRHHRQGSLDLFRDRRGDPGLN
jgi:hypothetical protein